MKPTRQTNRPAPEVQVLKGVNIAFRRDAIDMLRFDARLRGTGAQVHCEMAFSLDVPQRGWPLIYDPSLRVDHFPAQRSDEYQRGGQSQRPAQGWCRAALTETR